VADRHVGTTRCSPFKSSNLINIFLLGGGLWDHQDLPDLCKQVGFDVLMDRERDRSNCQVRSVSPYCELGLIPVER